MPMTNFLSNIFFSIQTVDPIVMENITSNPKSYFIYLAVFLLIYLVVIQLHTSDSYSFLVQEGGIRNQFSLMRSINKFRLEDAVKMAKLFSFNENYFHIHTDAFDANVDQFGPVVNGGHVNILANDNKTILGPWMNRETLGSLLESLNFTVGIEVGVGKGIFAKFILTLWESCEKYYLVDYDEIFLNTTRSFLLQWDSKLESIHNKSVEAAVRFQNESVDFIYIDAQHNYCNVSAEMRAYWPKLRPYGIMAGHDFMSSTDGGANFPELFTAFAHKCNGVEHPGAVKGAVMDFAREMNQIVFATYKMHEWQQLPTWIIQKRHPVSI